MSDGDGDLSQVTTPESDWVDADDWVRAGGPCLAYQPSRIAGDVCEAIFTEDGVRYRWRPLRVMGLRFSVGHSGERDE